MRQYQAEAHGAGTRAQKNPPNSKVCSQDVHFPCFFPSVMSLIVIRVNLRSNADRIPDCTGERSLEKKRSPVTTAFLMGVKRAASGQRCHGRLSIARRALSLFSWKCVCVRVYSGFGDPYKGAIGDGARTSWDMLAKQTAGAARAQESSTICPLLGC